MEREILYSPGFGAGWTSWNHEDKLQDFMAEYRPIIKFLQEGGEFGRDDGDIYGYTSHGKLVIKEDAHPLLKQLYQDAVDQGLIKDGEYICMLGARDLEVTTVYGPYRIDEYDGSESVVVPEQQTWH